VIHQDNQKLPAALSRGFEAAKGEFLSWTSCDNRWKPDGIARLMDYLVRHPDVDFTYGNLDVIGRDGRPLRNSPHYQSYQHPHGSEHIQLPSSPLELNTAPKQFHRRRIPVPAGRRKPSWRLRPFAIRGGRLRLLDARERADDRSARRRPRGHRRVPLSHESSLTARWNELGMLEARDELMEFDAVRGAIVTSADGVANRWLTGVSFRHWPNRVRRAGHTMAIRALGKA
jgi:glycosyltransferase involved in cell wall biosynthesis